ncbi:glycosyltransferase [Eubacterium sp.]
MRSGFVCKVSVIVTVYNTEKYVEECIISLINQTYKNMLEKMMRVCFIHQ